MTYQVTLEWNDDDFYQDTMNAIQRLPTPEVVAEKQAAALDGMLDTITTLGNQVKEAMDAMPNPPSELEMTFGMRLGAEKGIITKSNTNAHFVFTLKW